MAYPGATICLLDETGYSVVDYRDTEHYAVTKAFLDQPARMLEALFTEGSRLPGR